MYFDFVDLVLENEGVVCFSVFVFATCLWRSYSWEGVCGSPYSYLDLWLNSKLGAFYLIPLFSIAQLLGGSLAYSYYNQFIWSFHLIQQHKYKYANGLNCKSHVQVSTFLLPFTLCVQN